LDIKILSRKGVFESLELLANSEANTMSASDLRRKTGISNKVLRLFEEQGILKKNVEKIVVREIPINRKLRVYSLTEKGKKLIKLYESLTEDEAKEYLKFTSRQLMWMRFLHKEGEKRSRDIPNCALDGLKRLVKRGFISHKIKNVTETRKIYRMNKFYRLTEKGKKVYEAYKAIASL